MPAEETAPKQRGVPFQPGQSGNPAGRPKGARSKLSEDFVSALYEDFQAAGKEAIQTVRAERPHEYLKVIAGLLPKELKVTTESDLTDEQLDKRIRDVAAILNLELFGSEAGTGGTADGAQTSSRPN